jgi:hypothetical protein
LYQGVYVGPPDGMIHPNVVNALRVCNREVKKICRSSRDRQIPTSYEGTTTQTCQFQYGEEGVVDPCNNVTVGDR